MRSCLACLFVMFALVACGDDGGGGGNGNIDAPSGTVDAPNNPPVDAPPMGMGGIGTKCTPSAQNPQGDCPSGFLCLNLQGGSHAWCSKLCTKGAGDTCAQGYTGPGLASCYLTVTPQGGNPMDVCGIVCADQTGNNSICPAAQCNGTCPAMLMCTSELRNQMGTVVAKGCQ